MILYSFSTGGNTIYEMFNYLGDTCFVLWNSEVEVNPLEINSTQNQNLLYAYLARWIQQRVGDAWEQLCIIKCIGWWTLLHDCLRWVELKKNLGSRKLSS